MHTFGDDYRFLIASYGRAASVAIGERINSYIIVKTNIEPTWCTFGPDQFGMSNFDSSFNDRKYVIGHCHSLMQIQHSYEKSVVFFAFRNPSEVALSNYIADKLQYHHKYKQQYVSKLMKLEDKSNLHEHAIQSYINYNKNNKIDVNTVDINWLRSDCIDWNNEVKLVLSNVQYYIFNYDKWKGNVSNYFKSLKIKFDTDHLSVEMNPKKWYDQVNNVVEVQQWLENNKSDDEKWVSKWAQTI